MNMVLGGKAEDFSDESSPINPGFRHAIAETCGGA